MATLLGFNLEIFFENAENLRFKGQPNRREAEQIMAKRMVHTFF